MSRTFWTNEQIKLLVQHYPNMPMPELIKTIGRDEKSIYSKARSIGVKRSQEYLDSPHACRLRPGDNIGKEFRFKKGNKAWNKGVSVNNGGEAGWFPKGNKPANYRPVGTIRAVDGYQEIKVAEGMRQWKLLHRVVWERMNGKIPKGMVVIFLDGNTENIEITNLSLMTKAQNMKRNTIHNYPKEIAVLVQLQGAINRQINKRTKQNEQLRHA